MTIKNIVLVLISILLLNIQSSHAGAAMCIAKEKTPKNNQTDAEYFLRWNSTDKGYKVQSIARKDFKAKYQKGTPSCRSSGGLLSGYFVVIKNVRKNYAKETRVTFAFGYGTTRSAAETDAVEELGRRNWSWKKKEGYTVEEVQQF